jgi:hypothetical protein
VAGVTTLAAANTYIDERFRPDYHATFTRPPRDPASAFVPLGAVDLEQILCEEEERTVGQDNIVAFDGLALQVAKQPGRPTCAGLRVLVRRHLDGQHTVWRGPQCLGRYDAQGQSLPFVPTPSAGGYRDSGPRRQWGAMSLGGPPRRRHPRQNSSATRRDTSTGPRASESRRPHSPRHRAPSPRPSSRPQAPSLTS